MRLADSDLTSIPGAAAWFDSTSTRVAETLEWRGTTPGSVQYRAGELTLLVTPGEYDANIDALCGRLVDTLENASEQTSSLQRLRLQMVAASLRIALGRHRPREGSTDEVIASLDAALELSNPPLPLDCGAAEPRRCASPDVIGLALKQLATNAQRHGGATALRLVIDDGPTFRLRWRGSALAQKVVTSRHPGRRARWGAGFARLAADAVGAVIYDPLPADDGMLEVTFAIQPSDMQLRLPLALVDSAGAVTRATRSWDEETHALPGQQVEEHQAAAAVQRAGACPGKTAVAGEFAARMARSGVWVTLLPADTQARAKDVIAGLAHEHDLLRAPEPYRTQVLGLAAVIRCSLGQIPDPWDPTAVAGPYRTATTALKVAPDTLAVPPTIPCAPDPLLTAFLVAELGGQPIWDFAHQRWLLDTCDPQRSPTVSAALTKAGGPIFLT